MKDTVTEEKYSQMLELQKRVNLELQELIESNKAKGRDKLAKILEYTGSGRTPLPATYLVNTRGQVLN